MICKKFIKKKKNENHPQFYHSDRYLSHITQGPENAVLPHRGSPQKLSQSAIKKNSANWRVSCVQLNLGGLSVPGALVRMYHESRIP